MPGICAGVAVRYGGVEVHDCCFAFPNEERRLTALEALRFRFGPEYFEAVDSGAGRALEDSVYRSAQGDVSCRKTMKERGCSQSRSENKGSQRRNRWFRQRRVPPAQVGLPRVAPRFMRFPRGVLTPRGAIELLPEAGRSGADPFAWTAPRRSTTAWRLPDRRVLRELARDLLFVQKARY